MKPDQPSWPAGFSAFVIGASTLLGVEVAITVSLTGGRQFRSIEPVAVCVTAIASPILEPGAILLLTAAAIILRMVLRTGSPQITCPIAQIVSLTNRIRPGSARKQSIAYHTGGLYGP